MPPQWNPIMVSWFFSSLVRMQNLGLVPSSAVAHQLTGSKWRSRLTSEHYQRGGSLGKLGVHLQIFCISFQFFAFLCIGQTDFWKSCHCINLECSMMPGSAAIGFNSKCFMLLSDRVNLKCPHFNLRHQPKLKGGFWLDREGTCLVCMRPI